MIAGEVGLATSLACYSGCDRRGRSRYRTSGKLQKTPTFLVQINSCSSIRIRMFQFRVLSAAFFGPLQKRHKCGPNAQTAERLLPTRSNCALVSTRHRSRQSWRCSHPSLQRLFNLKFNRQTSVVCVTPYTRGKKEEKMPRGELAVQPLHDITADFVFLGLVNQIRF